MKKSFLLPPFLLFASGFFAQKALPSVAGKQSPPYDPTQLQAPPPDTAMICVRTACDDESVEGVEFNFTIGPPFLPPPPNFWADSVTGANGCARIFALSQPSGIAAPEKDTDPLNGVTTRDLLLIHKHILGVEPLDSPYKMIAADANKSGSITGFDIVELRRLILGIYSELPTNTSWRFVAEDFVFLNPNNPFQSGFSESDTILPFGTTEFLGIKVGDVDCTANANSNQPPPTDYPDAQLVMPDTLLLAGQVYDIPIFLVGNDTWAGYQFALKFDPQRLEFQSMTTHQWSSNIHWNTLLAAFGTLNTSWFWADSPVAFGSSTPLAVFRFRALSNVSLKDEVTLSNQTLRPEGYAGWEAEYRDLLLTFLPQLRPSPSDPTVEKALPPYDPTLLGDFGPPTVLCQNAGFNAQQQGIAVVSVPHFLQTASDNATPLDRLTFGIRKAGTGTGFPLNGLGGARTHEMFRCDELGTHTIELWVKDLAGNTSFCEATVTVQDLMSLCPPESAGAFVEVCMNTQANDGVEEGHFEVSGNNPNGSFEITDWTLGGGCGLFEVPLGSDVTIAPNKNDNPLNGVTVYDLVLISKHILGIELLDSPYKMIAADTDRNGLIDSTDIVELRKLIMGTYTELPNNTSWRFVPKDYQFADPSNPFSEAFPESASFNNLQGYERAQFVGIKVGDVNNTSVVNFKGIGSEERGGIKVGDVNNTAVANFTGIGSEERGGIREHHEVTVGQPRPNPTLDAAALPIYLPTAENLRLEISDLTGRIIWANDLQLEMGSHALEIPASTLPSAGVYVWRVRTGEISKAGKLLRH